MRLFKVILADDEIQILQGMRQGIAWEEYGFEVAGLAANGKEALELVETLRPDVLISDIKMPFMDGLEMVERLQESFVQVKVILFSGFDDFEYAQKAIRYGVTDYMLKPIDFPQMEELLHKLYKQLVDEIKEKNDRKKLLEMYQESLPIMREQFLMGLARGTIPEEKIEKRMRQYKISWNGCYYCAVLFQIVSERKEMEEDTIIRLPMIRMVIERLEKVCQVSAFGYFEREALILCMEKREMIEQVLKCLNETGILAERLLQLGFFCGVGEVCENLMELEKSFQSAQEALEYSVVSEDERVLYIQDIQPRERTQDCSMQYFFMEEKRFQRLEGIIKAGKEEEIKKEIDQIFAQLEGEHFNINQCQSYILQIVVSLIKIIHQYHLEEDEAIADTGATIKKILSIQIGESLKNWLYNYCVYIHYAIRQKRIDSNSMLAQKAKNYVDIHYSDSSLSVDTMCNYLNVSASHFSIIFKKENGISFINYLTHKRIMEAIRLLQTTDEKSRVIGERVGYPEPNYFSYVFKKTMDVSPANFRKQYREKKEKESYAE